MIMKPVIVSSGGRNYGKRTRSEIIAAMCLILAGFFMWYSSLRAVDMQRHFSISDLISDVDDQEIAPAQETDGPQINENGEENDDGKSQDDIIDRSTFLGIDLPDDGSIPPIPNSPPLIQDELSPYFEHRFLPRPQMSFPANKPLRYQMHNCLRGRDGGKYGLRNAGVPWLIQQKVKSLQKSTSINLMLFDDASVILACNNERPSTAISRNPKINGHKLIATSIGLVDKYCLGSVKAQQLNCRRELAQKFGCEYESLGFQPMQYILRNKRECEQVMAQKVQRPWLMKPSASARGVGIRHFHTTNDLQKEITQVGGCEKLPKSHLSDILIQEYVNKPALLDGRYKFDVRTWLLIASVEPLIMFYHDGFVKVAKIPYDENSNDRFSHITNLLGQEKNQKNIGDLRQGPHTRSFDDANKQLTEQYGLPPDFMKTEYARKVNRAQLFAALSQFMRPPAKGIPGRKGFFHNYACDSVLDRFGGMHLLECNGFPAESQMNVVENGIQTWWDMMSLVLNMHLEPWRLLNDTRPPPGVQSPEYARRGHWKNLPKIVGEKLSVKEGYTYGDWKLCFNEIETPFQEVNLCHDANVDEAVDRRAKEAMLKGEIPPPPLQKTILKFDPTIEIQAAAQYEAAKSGKKETPSIQPPESSSRNNDSVPLAVSKTNPTLNSSSSTNSLTNSINPDQSIQKEGISSLSSNNNVEEEEEEEEEEEVLDEVIQTIPVSSTNPNPSSPHQQNNNNNKKK